ncbi:MAG: extracellular solute-binding protein [Lachnospiraceae bacterium]|nr:extracellular solute-binding protein [Lachnospiraceae bacterium]
MKKMKRILSILIIGIMILSLCACGKKEGENINKQMNEATDPSLSKQYVFHAKDLDLGIDFSQVAVHATMIKNDRIYMVMEDYNYVLLPDEAPYASKVDGAEEDIDVTVEMPAPVVTAPDVAIEDDIMIEDGVMQPIGGEVYFGPNYVLVSVNTDGSDKMLSKLEKDATMHTGWIGSWSVLDDGSVIGINENWSEDLSDPENPIYETKYLLMKWDDTGALKWSVDISGDNGEYIYAQKILQYKGNIVLITGDSQILTFNNDGKELSRKKIEGADMNNGGQVIVREDGKALQITYNNEYTKIFVSELDLETCQMKDKVELPGNITNYGLYPGKKTDFILNNSTGIYTFNVGDAEPVKIMDFVNSDLATYSLENITFINDKEFIATYNDVTTWTNHVARFTYVDPATIQDKVTLLLGCNYLSSEIRKDIIDFNKTNNQYRITIKDYSVYSTPDDYMQSYTQMNNDIISGNMPDIMVLDSSQDITSWVNKGLLVDIGEMIAKDEELSKLEYLDNIWKAFAVNDKQYIVIPAFTVQTMVARKDLVGNRNGWTMSEFQQFMATQPDDVKPFGDDILRDNMMYYIMQYCGSDFVDVNTGKCNFDSPEFIAMLEFANTLPKEFSEDYWENYDWMAMESMYRDKKAVMMNGYIYNIQNMVYNIHGTLGDEANFIGFPGIEGNSSVIMPSNNMFAVSAKSANADGAWEFVRGYLTEEYQNSEQLYEMPVLKSAFVEKAKKATEKPYYIDEVTGEKVEYDDYYWINDEQIVLEPFSQKEVDDICNFIYALNKRSYYNQNIINIVNEEAGSYFEGQKSAKEVAQIIQSRVQIYVDENS